MTMLDSGKRDHKILAICVDDPVYAEYHEADELPSPKLAMLRRFFQDNKILEGKSVEVDEMQHAEAAIKVIQESLDYYTVCRRSGKFHDGEPPKS